MKMRYAIIFSLLILVSFSARAQGEVSLYKNLYKAADSLKLKGKVGVLDPSVYQLADSLDGVHPAAYFYYATTMTAEQHYNEGAFLFYLGKLRYRYYNSANPAYQASDDGALSAALSATIGEPINMYLRADIDNFDSIMKLCVAYYEKHDYRFFSKNKDIEKYNKQSIGIRGMIADIEKDKATYQAQWAEERKSIEGNFDEMLKMEKEKKGGEK